MSTLKRMGLDLDGVLYDFHGAARFLLNQEFGLSLPPVEELWSGWNGHRRYVTREQEKWLWTEGVVRGLFRYGHLLKGGAEALRRLSVVVDIVVITHRPRSAVLDTLNWLSYVRLPLTELHILSDGQAKSGVPCNLYLDDGPHVMWDVAANRPDSMALLWDRPWNQAVIVPDSVVRVASWEEVFGVVGA